MSIHCFQNPLKLKSTIISRAPIKRRLEIDAYLLRQQCYWLPLRFCTPFWFLYNRIGPSVYCFVPCSGLILRQSVSILCTMRGITHFRIIKFECRAFLYIASFGREYLLLET